MVSNEGDTKESTAVTTIITGMSRAIITPLLFYFKSPLKLFRPARASSWMVISAMAEAEQKRVNFRYLHNLYVKKGPLFIFNNISAPFVANTLVGWSLFGTFALANTHLAQQNLGLNDFTLPFVAGALAGACQSIISSPIDYLKLRFSLADIANGKYRHAYDYVIKQLFQPHGLLKAYRGISLTFCKDIIGYSTFFGVYENGKEFTFNVFKSLNFYWTGSSELKREFPIQSISVVIAGILTASIYTTLTYPFDIIRLSLYSTLKKNESPTPIRHRLNHLKYPLLTTLSHLSLSIREMGLRRTLYKGFSLNISRSLLPSAFALFIFDIISGSLPS